MRLSGFASTFAQRHRLGCRAIPSTREAGLSSLFILLISAAQEYPLVPMLAGSSGGTRNRKRGRGSEMREKVWQR